MKILYTHKCVCVYRCIISDMLLLRCEFSFLILPCPHPHPMAHFCLYPLGSSNFKSLPTLFPTCSGLSFPLDEIKLYGTHLSWCLPHLRIIQLSLNSCGTIYLPLNQILLAWRLSMDNTELYSPIKPIRSSTLGKILPR